MWDTKDGSCFPIFPKTSWQSEQQQTLQGPTTLCMTTIQNSLSGVVFFSAFTTHCLINAVHSEVEAACDA